MVRMRCVMWLMVLGAVLGCLSIGVRESQGADLSQGPRYDRAPYPRIAMLWASLRGDNSMEAMAHHNLMMLGAWSLRLQRDSKPEGLADGFTSKSLALARQRVAELRRLNPDAVIIGDMVFYEYPEDWLPEDHVWWMRDKAGKRVQFWPGTYRMDWYNAEYRQHVIRQTVSLKSAGVDGVFYDNLREEKEPWVAFLKELREAVGDDFLVMANSGYAVGKHDFAAPYLNGFMYESGWSHGRTEWDETIQKMQHTETLLREPRVSLIERFEEERGRAGWPGDEKRGQKPQADAAARRWSLCYSLIVGDFYYLFSDNTSHKHDWYPEYDLKIGLPQGEGKRVSSHVWQRRYEEAQVTVNLPGAKSAYVVTTAKESRDTLTGKTGKEFSIAPGDGCVLLAIEK